MYRASLKTVPSIPVFFARSPRQIHQVQLERRTTSEPARRASIPIVKMQWSANLVHRRLGDDAVGVAHEGQVERFLLRARHLRRQVAQVGAAVLVFLHRHLRKVLQPFVRANGSSGSYPASR